MVGKDLFALANGLIMNPHRIKRLQCFLPFLCKIRAKSMVVVLDIKVLDLRPQGRNLVAFSFGASGGSSMRFFSLRSMYLVLSVLAVLFLGACGYTPVTRTVWDAIGTGQSVDAIKLNPNLRYLRVTVRGRVVLMVLGYMDASLGGAVETWYSSDGELLRLQNGRVVATAGLETDWRAVRPIALPGWKDMLGRSSVTYQRERDEMPGFRFGISETISLYAVRTPTNPRLMGLPAQSLRWFEEAVQGQPGGLPSARYALRIEDSEPRVVYAEQCLSPTFCLAWQIWPAQ